MLFTHTQGWRQSAFGFSQGDTPDEIETSLDFGDGTQDSGPWFVDFVNQAEDYFTADLLTARIGKHEENAWMLRALIS